MNGRISGRFYFKKTVNGNLIGEYSHHESVRNYGEAATRTSIGSDWVGDYTTTWCESPINECRSARLEISAKEGCDGIFTLKWRSNPEPDGERLFSGEAMLCDDMLVGDYTNE